MSQMVDTHVKAQERQNDRIKDMQNENLTFRARVDHIE